MWWKIGRKLQKYSNIQVKIMVGLILLAVAVTSDAATEGSTILTVSNETHKEETTEMTYSTAYPELKTQSKISTAGPTVRDSSTEEKTIVLTNEVTEVTAEIITELVTDLETSSSTATDLGPSTDDVIPTTELGPSTDDVIPTTEEYPEFTCEAGCCSEREDNLIIGSEFSQILSGGCKVFKEIVYSFEKLQEEINNETSLKSLENTVVTLVSAVEALNASIGDLEARLNSLENCTYSICQPKSHNENWENVQVHLNGNSTIGISPSITTTDLESFTFCTWVKTKDVKKQALLSYKMNGENDYNMIISCCSSVKFSFRHDREDINGDYFKWKDNITLTDGQWHYLCIVWSRRSSNVTLYDCSTPLSPYRLSTQDFFTNPISANGVLEIGHDPYDALSPFNGIISQANMWVSEFTGIEIRELWCAQTTTVGVIFSWTWEDIILLKEAHKYNNFTECASN